MLEGRCAIAQAAPPTISAACEVMQFIRTLLMIGPSNEKYSKAMHVASSSRDGVGVDSCDASCPGEADCGGGNATNLPQSPEKLLANLPKRYPLEDLANSEVAPNLAC